eukprot:11750-Heterococcus_DN1.PRE.1
MLQSCALLLLALAARVAAATFGEYSAIFEGGSAATHTLSFSPDAATGEYAESRTHWAEAMEGSHPVVELNDGDTATLSEDVYSINFAPGQLQPQSSSAACSRASTLRCSWSTLPASSAQPCWGQRGTFKRQFLKETKNRPQERNSQ